MKKLNLNIDQQLISESARREITTEPEWWRKLGETSRKNYLAKHPNSQMAKFIKKQLAEKKKRKAKSKPEAKAERAFSDRKSKAKPERTFSDRTPANDEVIEKQTSSFAQKVQSRLKDFFANRKTRVRDYTQTQLKAVGEKLTRQEIKKRAAEKLPMVKQTMAENRSKFMGSVKSVASYISQALSPTKKEGLGSWLKARLNGKTTSGSGEDTGKLVAIHVITAALGLGALVAVTAGVAPIAGALAGAFFGFNDYRRSLPKKIAEETTKKSKAKPVEDPKDLEEESAASLLKDADATQQKQPDAVENKDEDEDIDPESVREALRKADEIINDANNSIESKSSDEEEIDIDPVQYLTEEIALWLRDQDQDLIAEKIAELVAIEEMVKEGWKPNISDLSEEELDQLINPEKHVIKEMTSESADEDFESEFVDEPEGSVKKLTLRCDKECYRLPLNERWRYNIRYGNNIIGNIRCVLKNTGGKFSRNWICVLEDGFNESVYRSGKPQRNDVPYTLLKNGKIYLVNPIKQTFDEAWAWAKLNIDKDYL